MAGARSLVKRRTVPCPRCTGHGTFEVEVADTPGDRIRTLRENARIPRVTLAARVGISEHQLGDIEAGGPRVTFALACSLADALGVSVSALRPKRARAKEQPCKTAP